MNILTAVSGHDYSKLAKHIQVFLKFGGLEGHSLTYLVTPSVKSAVEGDVEPLRAICPNLTIHPIEMEPQGDKTKQCNYLFYRGAKLAMEMKLPWLWLELDAYPIKKSWADKIAVGYATMNVPFAGHLVNYEVRDANGHLSRPFGDMDKYMMGVGMYPANCFDRCRTLINDFSKGASSATDPFDVYLKPDISNSGMAHFPLINDQCRTKNFRLKDGELVCTPADIPENWPTRRGKVAPEAMLVHGCKDDTLADLILASGPDGLSFGPVAPQNAFQHQIQYSPAKEVFGTPEANYVTKEQLSGILEANKKETISAMADMMRDFLKTEKTQIKVQETSTVPMLDNEPLGIWPMIQQCLNLQKYRLSDLAKTVDLPKDQLKDLLESKGYEIHGPAQWVKLKEPVTA